MGMTIKHIKRWNEWRKHNKNSIVHKILVLFGIIKSPTFYCAMTKEEARTIYDGFMEALKDGRMTIDESIKELEKARDSIEPCLFLDEAIDQSMKTAIETMHKYQKIKEIISKWDVGIYDDEGLCDVEVLEMISSVIDGEVIEDGNVD